MVLLGYDRTQVIKITRKSPDLLGRKTQEFSKKIDSMVLLGYTREDVIKMTMMHPSIYCYSIRRIGQRLKDLILLGYTEEQVIKITKEYPAIFGSSLENISDKIKYYDSIGLHDVAIITPKNLMQSLELSYARYEFYKTIDVSVDLTNFRKLFIGKKRFEKENNITTSELLEQYDYNARVKIK